MISRPLLKRYRAYGPVWRDKMGDPPKDDQKVFSQTICPMCGKLCEPLVQNFCDNPCYYRYQECQGQCLPDEEPHEELQDRGRNDTT